MVGASLLGKKKLLLIILALGLSTQSALGQKAEPTEMRVYFIEFDALTYIPITVANIQTDSAYAIRFAREHPFISKLNRLLTSRKASGKLEDAHIRLKVELEKKTFIVDRKGLVLELNSGSTFVLSASERREIEKGILYFSGVVDLKSKVR